MAALHAATVCLSVRLSSQFSRSHFRNFLLPFFSLFPPFSFLLVYFFCHWHIVLRGPEKRLFSPTLNFFHFFQQEFVNIIMTKEKVLFLVRSLDKVCEKKFRNLRLRCLT